MKNTEVQQVQEIIEKLEGLEASLQRQIDHASNPAEKVRLAVELGGIAASRKALETVA